MQKAYSRINWENYPSTETPLNETNLNRIDLALDTVDDRVVTFDLTKANQTDLLTCVDGITFNTSTGILTISFKNGTTATIDTGLAKLAVNFDYDDDPTSPHYQQLILEMKDGTYKYIDLSSMITQFEFDNTSTVVFNVDAQTGHISAVVPDGSITANKLDPNVVVTMQAIEDAAEADALKSEGHAVGKQNGQDVGPDSPYYHNNAKYYCEQAQGGGSGGHVIKDSTTTYTQRNGLKFLGKASVSDDANGDNTIVTIEAGGAVPHLIVLSEAGSTVRAVKGTKTIYATETSAEHFECDLEMDDPQDIYGVWTIHAVLNGDDAMMSLNVDTIKVYVVDDSHMHADITVTYPNGATVSCSMTGAPTQYATSSPYTFVVHSYGVWRITGTRGGVTEIHDVTIYENGQEEEVTLSLIPEGSTVTPTDDIQLWLACAGIEDKPYTMLQQVLADSATLLKVLTNDNASDYLARSTTWVTGITVDSNAMVIIGSYDYCANALLDSGSTWKEAIVSSTYANSVENISTPTMTSNSTPSGVCSASTIYSSAYDAYKAFDKDASTLWASTVAGASNAWLRYKFASAVKINAVKIKTVYSGSLRVKTLSIKASNDDFSTIETLMATTTLADQNVEDYVYLVNPSIAFNSYGLADLTTYVNDVEFKEVDFLGRENGGAQSWLKAGGIQKSYTQLSQILGDTATLRDLMASNDAVDYLVTAKAFIDDICANQTAMSLIGANDYAADTLLGDSEWLDAISNSTYKSSVLNVSVPKMTSNTAPKGECISGSNYSSYENWNAFDKNTATFWASNTVAITNLNDYICYKFVRPVSVKFFKEMARQDSGHTPLKDYDICGSNDGTNWTVLYTNLNEPDVVTGIEISHSFTNNNSYLYYRLYIRSAWRGQRIGISILDFLGRETGGVQTWLHSAGIVNKNYTTVAEVLADTSTLLILMTNDDAIDYLVTAKAFINDICADQTAMSYIGSYDYCKSTLVGDDDWCEGIVKSAYVYSVMTVNIPAMTSNTTPSGTASASGQYQSQYPYYAFDRAGTYAMINSGSGWIRYAFPKAVTIRAVYYQAQQADGWGNYLKASNDGTTWNTIYTFLKTSSPEYGIISNPAAYSMYEWDIQNTSQGYARLYGAQLYGYEIGGVQSWLRAGGITDKTYTTLAEVLADSTTLSALIASHDAVDYLVTAKGLIDGITSDATAMSYIGLNNYCSNTLLADADWANGIAKSANIESVSNVKVPTMTSATTPSGTVISDGVNYATGYDPWKAFRGATTGNLWCLQTALMSGNHYCGYIFTSAVKIFGFKMYRNSSASFTPTIKVQGSNDGNTWDDVYIIPTRTYANKAWYIFGFPLSDEYTQYRVYGVFNSAGSDEGFALQFYGREDV